MANRREERKKRHGETRVESRDRRPAAGWEPVRMRREREREREPRAKM